MSTVATFLICLVSRPKATTRLAARLYRMLLRVGRGTDPDRFLKVFLRRMPKAGTGSSHRKEEACPRRGRPGTWVVGPRGDRLYGPDGKPIKDVDWGHDHGQGQPHAREWIDGERQPGRPSTEEESFLGDGGGDDGLIRPEDWR